MRKYAPLTVALVLLSVVVPSAVSAQLGGAPRSDGLQMSDFAAPDDMKQAEARNLRALLNKWTVKYCASPFSGCAVPAQEAYGELLERLQAAATMPDLQAWRQRAVCVDRCMMELAPPAPGQARAGCTEGCAGGAPVK
ncbi:MAG: hypothetical protein MUE57_10270 [Syntrophales bacterium]|nr:hypothetical protein [Syntrophales bacterium]MCU0584207.1 hypothetical protein [Syntrophales bacterium]